MCNTRNRPSYRTSASERTGLITAICTTDGCTWRSEPTTSGGMAGAKFDRHVEETHQ